MSEGILTHGCVVGVAALALGAVRNAGAIDLSKWAVDDITGANWSVSEDGQTVTQHLAGGASRSIFVSDFGSETLHVAGRASVGTSSDDDFFGFVLGYTPGEYAEENADYLVVDWKQADQFTSYWGESIFARGGMAVSRVSGAALGEEGDIDAWTHSGAYDEIARSASLGDVGWLDIVEYDFEIVYSPQRLQMWVSWEAGGEVHEVVALDVHASAGHSFPSGRFGFYSFSQDESTFSQWRTIPGPAPVMLLGAAGLGASVRRRR